MRVWNIQKTNFKVSDFLAFSKSDTLELSPSFQRRPVWPRSAKSYLIDTIVRGLPVPVIFLRDRTDLNTLQTVREVVDGQQRLRTILSYIAPSTLDDYRQERDFFQVLGTHNEELAKKDFLDLTNDLRQRILQYEFSVHVLPSDTDDADVLNIFSRMNSTGTKLNGQELRNAKFFGEFKKVAYQLALEQLERWRSWRIFTDDQIARMGEVQLTSELLIYLKSGVQQKTQSAINNYYKINEDEYNDATNHSKKFRKIMDKIEETLGTDISSTVFRRSTLFYALFACMDRLLSQEKEGKTGCSDKEMNRRIKRVSERIVAKKAQDHVIEATQRRLGHKASREAILNFLVTEVDG